MLAEIRTYTLAPGGQAPMSRQFDEVNRPIFTDLGFVILGPWLRPLRKGVQFIYIAEFDSAEDRESKWAAFGEDPRWVEAQALSQGAPELVAAVDIVEVGR